MYFYLLCLQLFVAELLMQAGDRDHPNELLQVLLSLISNTKYTVQELHETDAKIIIAVIESKKEVLLSMCDNGGGIPEEIFSRLGEPYVSSRVQSGTGLGIYMSKIIVEKHLLGTLSWETGMAELVSGLTCSLNKIHFKTIRRRSNE